MDSLYIGGQETFLPNISFYATVNQLLVTPEDKPKHVVLNKIA
jgi:hypothetical protein